MHPFRPISGEPQKYNNVVFFWNWTNSQRGKFTKRRNEPHIFNFIIFKENLEENLIHYTIDKL